MPLKGSLLPSRSAAAGALLVLMITSIFALPVTTVAQEAATTPTPQERANSQATSVAMASALTGSSIPFKLKPEAPSIFTPQPVFGQPDNVQGSGVEKQGVRKKYLALGILGLVGIAGGAVAIAQSNKYCTSNNISRSGQAQSICSGVHTAGEVMIPVNAGVAGLGFFLAFRHRH